MFDFDVVQGIRLAFGGEFDGSFFFVAFGFDFFFAAYFKLFVVKDHHARQSRGHFGFFLAVVDFGFGDGVYFLIIHFCGDAGVADGDRHDERIIFIKPFNVFVLFNGLRDAATRNNVVKHIQTVFDAAYVRVGYDAGAGCFRRAGCAAFGLIKIFRTGQRGKRVYVVCVDFDFLRVTAAAFDVARRERSRHRSDKSERTYY